MPKRCPKFGGDCLEEECMGYVKVESLVPENYPEERLIRYKDGKPITKTKTLVTGRCKLLE